MRTPSHRSLLSSNDWAPRGCKGRPFISPLEALLSSSFTRHVVAASPLCRECCCCTDVDVDVGHGRRSRRTPAEDKTAAVHAAARPRAAELRPSAPCRDPSAGGWGWWGIAWPQGRSRKAVPTVQGKGYRYGAYEHIVSGSVLPSVPGLPSSRPSHPSLSSPPLPQPFPQLVSCWSAAVSECGHLLATDSLALRDLGGAIVAELAATFPLPRAPPVPSDYVDVSRLAAAASGSSTPVEVEVRTGARIVAIEIRVLFVCFLPDRSSFEPHPRYASRCSLTRPILTQVAGS